MIAQIYEKLENDTPLTDIEIVAGIEKYKKLLHTLETLGPKFAFAARDIGEKLRTLINFQRERANDTYAARLRDALKEVEG